MTKLQISLTNKDVYSFDDTDCEWHELGSIGITVKGKGKKQGIRMFFPWNNVVAMAYKEVDDGE